MNDANAAVKAYLAPDERPVIIQFVTEAVKMEYASTQAGRPIFENRDFARVIIPGLRTTQTNEPVNEEHKARWPREYAAFKAGKELPLDGTPLSEWPSSHINRARIEELAYFNVRTVEHLAAIDDNSLQKMPMGSREMRQAAQKFLEVARMGTGPLERLLADRDKWKAETERLAGDLIESNERCARLEAQLKEKTHAGA